MRDDANKVFPKGTATHIRLQNPTRGACLGFVMNDAKPGEQFRLLTRAAVTSDSQDFYTYIEKIPGIVGALDIFINWDAIFQFLALLHEDGTGELYLNDFPVEIEAQARRNIEAGEAGGEDDLGDIRRLRFPTVTVATTDKGIYCFKSGWKFGLYFDLEPRSPLGLD